MNGTYRFTGQVLYDLKMKKELSVFGERYVFVKRTGGLQLAYISEELVVAEFEADEHVDLTDLQRRLLDHGFSYPKWEYVVEAKALKSVNLQRV